MDISSFQQLMKNIYFHCDSERGFLPTFVWFIEEIGEFAKALRCEDKKALKGEVADILAWLCSMCNLLNIDLENVATNKYDGKCPRCSKSRCVCDKL